MMMIIFNILWIWLSLTPSLTLAALHHSLPEPPKSIFHDFSEGLPKFDFDGDTKDYTNIPQLNGIPPSYEELDHQLPEETWNPSSSYQEESRKISQTPTFNIPKEFLHLDDIGSVLSLLGFDQETKVIAAAKKIKAQKATSQISAGDPDHNHQSESEIRKFLGVDPTQLLDPEHIGDLPQPVSSQTLHDGNQKLKLSNALEKKGVNAQHNELVESLKNLLKVKPNQKSRTVLDLLESTSEIKIVDAQQRKRKQIEMNKTLKDIKFELFKAKKAFKQTKEGRRV